MFHSFLNTEIYYIPTEKFKTNTVTFFFIDSLKKETVSKNAMIPAILRRGCKKFPEMDKISRHLEELYGASFDCGVIKKGEYQIIFFYSECISDKYITKKTSEKNSKDLFEESFELLLDIVADPVIDNGSFIAESVNQEKDNLKRLIESRVNDKVKYAIEKCFEEMCRDEPFGIYEYGDVTGLDEINEINLYEHYKGVMDSYPLKVYVTGDISTQKMEAVKNKIISIRTGSNKNNCLVNISTDSNVPDYSNSISNTGKIREVNEVLNITQAKLSIGFLTNTCSSDPDYYPLLFCDNILGGGINSKLFKYVREGAGLAYYIFSQFDKFKGMFVVSCGIDAQNNDKAVELILQQVDSIKSGNISPSEYESALTSIETGINSLKDNQLQIVDYYLSQVLGNTSDDFDSLLAKIRKVTTDDIKRVAGKIQPELIYLLHAGGMVK
ncbi:MAG TPA: pitrilysin family protein [Clostridiales bacterium]|nr:pitrilysin family protein [Clostridiales bacterium]